MSKTAPTVDLRPDHLEIVRDILRRHIPERKVVAFGSCATWTAKEYSDLDLAILGDEPLPLSVSAALADDFGDSDLPFKVDLIEWARLDESLRDRISQDQVAVQIPARRFEGFDGEDCWRKLNLGDCIVINDASYVPKKEQWPHINYLDTGNITKNRISDIQHLISGEDKIPSRARRKVCVGDIVYSTVRPNQRHHGILRKMPDHFLASTGFAVIRGKEDVGETDFIYWFLAQDHIVDHLHAIAENSTTAYPSIKPTDIERLKIKLPPLPTQRAIAHILGILDDKIELNRRMNETLEAMARAIFTDWFVDFGPTRAKMEGRDPYLPSEIWDLFPDALDAEGKPVGWRQGNLVDIADSPRRGINPTDVSEDTPYIGLKHIPRRSIAISEWESAEAVTSTKSVFKKGEFLFGKLAPHFHKVGLAPLDGICSTDIIVVVPRAPEWGAFVLTCISSSEFVDYTGRTSTGTTMPRTSWKTMGRYKIHLPSEQIARTFQDLVQLPLSRIDANIHENRALVQLRDTLLPRLLGGKIELPETMTEEAS